MTIMVMGSPGPMGWLGSGGGGSSAPFWPCEGDDVTSSGCSGWKPLGTTALGITETARGFSDARRVVFSLLH